MEGSCIRSWLSVRMTSSTLSPFLFVNPLTSCLKVGSSEVIVSTFKSFLSPAMMTLQPGCSPRSLPTVATKNSASLFLCGDLGGE